MAHAILSRPARPRNHNLLQRCTPLLTAFQPPLSFSSPLLSTGDVYEGQHEAGLPHGQGCFTYVRRDVFEQYSGDFSEGVYEGHGEYRSWRVVFFCSLLLTAATVDAVSGAGTAMAMCTRDSGGRGSSTAGAR